MKGLDKYIQESILDITMDTDILADAFKDGIVTNDVANEIYGPDVEEMTLPEGIVELGFDAFARRDKLRRVVLPSTLIFIGDGAFNECNNLEEVIFHPKTRNLKEIGQQVFEGCTKLTSMYLPDCVEYIYATAFCGTDITNLHVPANLKDCGNAFNGLDHIKKVDLSHTRMKEISNMAFAYCTELEDIILPSTCTSIGNRAFMQCVGLNTIYTHNVENIDVEAFLDCENLNVVRAPKVKILRGGAFKECTSLTTVDLARGVSLDKCAFYGCSKLSKFNTPVSNMGDMAFSKTRVSEIYWTGEGKLSKDDRITKLNVLKPKNKLSGDARRQIEKIERYCEVTYADK